MSSQNRKLPLEGIRILDLTVVWAGPYAGMQLADWGAEVIRIESTHHFQVMTRGHLARPSKEFVALRSSPDNVYPDDEPGDRPWNRSATFNAHARNKLSMTVDLTRPEGQEVFDRLIEKADGIIENNVPISMERIGVTWERCSTLNPRIVMVRMPAFGLTGPYKNYRAMGAHPEAVAGHPLLRAYPGADLERGARGVPSDAASGIGGAFALLMGLRHRRRTGAGVLLEIAMGENFAPYLGEFIMDFTMNGRLHERLGNDHLSFAPHNAYPCQGNDRWIAIACRSDNEWQSLCHAMSLDELAQDTRFCDSLNRWKNRREVDRIIAEWTATQDATAVMHSLQAVGIPAGVVMNEHDVLHDPHLAARGFWRTLIHPDAGKHQHVAPLFKLEGIDNQLRRHAPRLGEDNEYVYKEVLGFSDDEYARFAALGHIGSDFDLSIA